ncbi:MAG: FG-GAP repeat protein [Acidobacteria bacterium]|nr:FG-GAP repeat protein [Acidobacteriota bacterium]
MKSNNSLGLTALLIILAMPALVFAQQGALDASWGTGGTGIYQDPLPATNDATNVGRRYGPVELLADGRAIVAGSATKSLGGGSYNNNLVIRRLNADGSADASFAGGAGAIETTFLSFNSVDSNVLGPVVAIQPADGKIVVAAQCTVNGAPNPAVDNTLGTDLCLWRFNANGTLDTTFGGNIVAAWGGNPNFPATSYTMPAGKVWTFTGTNQALPTVTTGFNGAPVRIRIATDGRIVVFGNSRDFVGANQTGRFKGFVAVYATNGALQSITSLADASGSTTNGFGATKINDGDILPNGDFLSVGSQSRLVSTGPAVFSQPKWIVFRNATGQFLDQVNTNPAEGAYGVAQLRSGKILVAGVAGSNAPQFVRYNSDLTFDATFGTSGRLIPVCGGNFCYDTQAITRMSAQSDGKITGISYNGNIFRLNPDGSPDRSYARYRTDIADSLAVRGILQNLGYTTPFPIRSGTDGRISYSSFAVRPNGRTIVSGAAGISPGGPNAQAVAAQLKTYLKNGGTFSDLNNDGASEVAVFRPTDGVWHNLDSFTGGYTPVQFGLSGDKLAPADYDGDGKTDRAVFRNGVWYIFQSSNNQVRFAQWGQAGDLPRPGDFNGDGFADIAVFRPSNGTWYIAYSNPVQPGGATINITTFGQSGDAPLVADFDGDGKSDVSVFRSGTWYFIRSGDGSIGIVNFGLAGDVPVTGDYDADGKSDIAVFRAGVWYALRSSDGSTLIQQFGINGDKPVPGDYDNDGKNDLAVYRNGVWWIQRSSDGGVSATNFGLATDLPIETAYLP